jgi:hypothetical protein
MHAYGEKGFIKHVLLFDIYLRVHT